MAYTTNALVMDILGTYVNTATDLPAAELDAHIARADATINDRLGGFFYPFNATTSTPATPGTIQEISRNLSIALSLEQIVGTNNMGAFGLAEKHRQISENWMAFVLANPDTWMKEETKTGEVLTWGTTPYTFPWQIADNQAILAKTSPLDSGDPPTILPSSVRITAASGGLMAGISATQLDQIRNGVDFTVSYDPQRSNWILEANDSRLYQGTSITVAYEWTYRRLRGAQPEDLTNSSALLVSQFG